MDYPVINFTLWEGCGMLSIECTTSVVKAIEHATFHRDEGPAVVTVKCSSFEDAEALTTMLATAKQFIEASRREN